MNNGSIDGAFSAPVTAVDPAGYDDPAAPVNAAHAAENAPLPVITDAAAFIPEPVWMPIARKEIGEREVRGVENNPRILLYGKSVALKVTSDEVPWCSNFVNWVLQKAQMESTQSAAARSWATWGEALEAPIYGAVVVLSRDGGGHVGFFRRIREDGKWVLLGGNQSDSVCEAAFDADRVIAVRWPVGMPQLDFVG